MKKEDLRPTCDEMQRELSPESDYEFLQRLDRMYHDPAQLEEFVYSEEPGPTILQTMVCLFRIAELMAADSVNLEITIPIIVYLQDKEQYQEAHVHSLYAFQNTDFSDAALLDNVNDGHTKIRMLYECHAENLYHLGAFQAVRECAAEFNLKFSISSYRMHHLSFFANIQRKEFGDAFTDISRAIELTPDCATLYNHRCFVLCEMKQFERALKDANKCLEIDPQHQIGLNNRGSVFNDLEQYELALVDLDRAIELSDGCSANCYRHRAFAHYMLGHYGEAIEDVTTAISMKEEYPEAEELRVRMWKEIHESAAAGINQYFANSKVHMFLEPIVHLVTDFVVGTEFKAQ